MNQSSNFAEFITTTCLEWKPVIHGDLYKDEIIESMRFLVQQRRVVVYAFVIMHNHFHLIWQMLGEYQRAKVQRDFLKFTAQKILMHLRNERSPLLMELRVDARDRKHQVWERNSLSVPLWSPKVWQQKINYIHNNPVRAGYCLSPEDYKYSSASQYLYGEKIWDFLTVYQ